MATCEHTSQKYSDGKWLCAACGKNVPSEGYDRDKVLSVRVGGLENLKQFRDLGVTEREYTKDNIKRFRDKKGYDPVREDGKDRWI